MPTITVRKEVTKAELRELLYEQIYNRGPEHFNQRSWASVDGQTLALNEIPTKVDLDSCGTTACLAGHAAALGAKVNLDTRLDDTTSMASTFGLDPTAFAYTSAEWPSAMRSAYQASKAVNPNEQDAEWWGALQYLISLRGAKD